MAVSTGTTTNTTVVHKLHNELRGNASTVKSLSLQNLNQTNITEKTKTKTKTKTRKRGVISKTKPCCINSIPSNQIGPNGMSHRKEKSHKPIYKRQQNQTLIIIVSPFRTIKFIY